jgi:hypothetical protein
VAKAAVDVGWTEVAFTGAAGVGKSVLADVMEGRARDLRYELPGESMGTETSAIAFGVRTRLVRVLPGQDARRAVAVDETFSRNESLQGIIHVVDYGYTAVRSAVASDQLVRDGIDTISKLRARNLKREIVDLAELASDIRRALLRNPKRRLWLAIVINKIDLFPDQRELAKLYYHPDGSSEFSRRLSDLRSDVGAARLRIEVVEACGHEEDLEFNGQTRRTKFAANEKEGVLKKFMAKLSQLVEELA